MPQWFVKGLRRGVVTTRYPAHADASASTLPTPPAFRPEELTAQIADRLVQDLPEPGPDPGRSRAALRRRGLHGLRAVPRGQNPGRLRTSGEFGLATTDSSAW